MKSRMDLLRLYWDNEIKKMIMNLVKIKFKSKKQKEYLQKLRSIPDDIKEAILQKYLNKCKTQNALDFYEWRKKIKQQIKNDKMVQL